MGRRYTSPPPAIREANCPRSGMHRQSEKRVAQAEEPPGWRCTKTPHWQEHPHRSFPESMPSRGRYRPGPECRRPPTGVRLDHIRSSMSRDWLSGPPHRRAYRSRNEHPPSPERAAGDGSFLRHRSARTGRQLAQPTPAPAGAGRRSQPRGRCFLHSYLHLNNIAHEFIRQQHKSPSTSS